MPNYRRNYVEGGTFFFTVVTAGRRHILVTRAARSILRTAIRSEQMRRPFDIVAFVLLPDHLHTIWTMPLGDFDYSTRWSRIKSYFSHHWTSRGGAESQTHPGQHLKRQRGVWQSRFLEHTIRDERDLETHVNYIHFNPVKHGHVQRPIDWKWSSLHRYISQGICTPDWGCNLHSKEIESPSHQEILE